MAQLGRKSYSGFCSKILCKQCIGQTDCPQYCHQQAHFYNIGCVSLSDAHINNGCYDQGDKKLKGCLQHLEQRAQNAFFFISFEVLKQFLHEFLLS